MNKNLKFQKKKIFTISVAHFFHDIYPAFFAPMLPLLMAKFGISLFACGILDIARRIPSLSTPFIGIIADKVPAKYFIILAPAVTAITMSLIGVVNSYLFVFLLLLFSGLSSICFHIPSPVLIKSFSGNQIGKGMSYYMSFGAIAGTAGTFLITLVITTIGIEQSYLLMVFGIITSIILYFRFHKLEDVHISKKQIDDTLYRPLKDFIPFFSILACVMFFRAGMSLVLTLYLPLYLTQNGASLWFAGISLSVLYLAGAVGMIAMGHISDKFSKRKLLFILIFCSTIAMWGLILMRTNKICIPILLVFLGIFLFASAPLILSLVQELQTKRPAFINSIYFTLGFLVNTTGILLVGYAGDNIGLERTFEICASLPILSLPFLILLSRLHLKEKAI